MTGKEKKEKKPSTKSRQDRLGREFGPRFSARSRDGSVRQSPPTRPYEQRARCDIKYDRTTRLLFRLLFLKRARVSCVLSDRFQKDTSSCDLRERDRFARAPQQRRTELYYQRENR